MGSKVSVVSDDKAYAEDAVEAEGAAAAAAPRRRGRPGGVHGHLVPTATRPPGNPFTICPSTRLYGYTIRLNEHLRH